MHSIILQGGDDWMATRLSPKKIYPPKPSDKAAVVNIHSRFAPGLIEAPGVEGFGVCVGQYKGIRSLLVSIALRQPFTDEAMLFAKRKLAKWNDCFNTWDIPILSQSKSKALCEVWGIIEDSFFELPWRHEVLELHWQYSISKENFARLQQRIRNLNDFWRFGVLNVSGSEPDLVYGGLCRQELERKALESFRQLYPKSTWSPQSPRSQLSLCVNYLRHRESAYHVMLAAQPESEYFRIFARINTSIAQAYPWLKQTAEDQIQAKRRG